MKDINNTNETNIKEEINHIDKDIKMSRNITYKDN